MTTTLLSPLEKIEIDWGIPDFYIKRLDKIRSWASGNKYYKLKYNIEDALKKGVTSIVSKGGMFSNHLEALSSACSHFEIQCKCIIRSYTTDENNPTIKKLRENNAGLVFMEPELYDLFDERQSALLYPESLFIPEGGLNKFGIHGASEIYDELNEDRIVHLVIAGGSMCTAAGILSVASPDVRLHIVPAWKGCTKNYLDDLFHQNNIQVKCQWDLWTDFHFGGFGKYNHQLADFMFSFTENTHIPLDPVYTGKMMYAIKDKMQSGYFSGDDKVIAIYTGGLQGLEGFHYRDQATWDLYYQMTRQLI